MKKPNSVEIAHSQNYETDNTQSCKRQIIIKQTEIEEKFLHTTRYVEFLFVPHQLVCSLENT